jgi:hypothetical protein
MASGSDVGSVRCQGECEAPVANARSLLTGALLRLLATPNFMWDNNV